MHEGGRPVELHAGGIRRTKTVQVDRLTDVKGEEHPVEARGRVRRVRSEGLDLRVHLPRGKPSGRAGRVRLPSRGAMACLRCR